MLTIDFKDPEQRASAWKRLARNGMDCQCASNLSGVVHGFSEDVRTLRELLQAEGTFEGTESVNKHPLCVLYATQIAFLSGGTSTHTEYSAAYKWAAELMEK